MHREPANQDRDSAEPEARDLLEQLAELAKEERTGEAAEERRQWESLAAGQLDSAEEEKLREKAGETPENVAALEAYSPLGADFHARIADLARQEMALDAGADGSSEAGEPSDRGQRSEPTNVIDARWRWQRLAPLAALAAALLLTVLWPGGQPAPLPGYTLQLDGRVETSRSGEDPATVSPSVGNIDGSSDGSNDGSPARFATGNRLSLVLTPASELSGDFGVRTFLVRGDQPVPFEGPAAELSNDGAARITGVIGEQIRLPAGDSILVVVLAREGRAPADAELWSRLETATEAPVRGEGWLGWKIPLRLESSLMPESEAQPTPVD